MQIDVRRVCRVMFAFVCQLEFVSEYFSRPSTSILQQISCQKKPESQPQPTEVPLGYTWLPLLRDGRLATGSLSLPVACDHPGANYSMLPPDVQLGTLASMKWVDNRKPVFDISIQAVTTVHALVSY